MPNALEDLLYESTVRLTTHNKLGTGFFVAPRQILTCAHIVTGVEIDGSGLTVEYDGRKLDVTFVVLPINPEYPDLALVTVKETEHPCVELATDDEPKTGDDLYAYGYPPDQRNGESVTVEYEGRARPYQDSNKWLLKFKDGYIGGGHSGSPLLNLKTGTVCGVVKSSNTNAWGFVAAGVPTQAVWTAFPELKTLHDDFHRLDARWANSRIQASQNQQADKKTEDPLACLARMPLDTIPAVVSLPAGSRMLFKRNRYFSGRKQNLLNIAQAMYPSATDGDGIAVVLTGMSGVGKTQLAVEFAHRYGQYFTGGVSWISFADPALIPAEIIECGERMFENPYDGKNSSDPEAQKRLKQKTVTEWESSVPRLLVFDNADTEDASLLIDRWRPKTGEARILVTSQQETWDPLLGLHVVPLRLFSRPESVTLLRKLQPDLAQGDAAAVAKAVDDLPLALHLAGSYLQLYYPDDIDVSQYLEELEGESLNHDSLTGFELDIRPTARELSVYNSFHASYRRLNPERALDKLALSLLLRAGCYLPGEPISWELLVRANHITKSTINGKERRRMKSALRRLAGLVNMVDNGAITMHRLVTAFIQLSSDSKDINAARTDVEKSMITLFQQEKGGLPYARINANQLRYVAEKADQRNSEVAPHLAALLVQARPIMLDCTIQLLDKGDKLTDIAIALVDEAVTARVIWEVPSLENKGLNGIWETNVFLESLSEYNDIILNTEPISLPVDRSKDRANYSVDIPITLNLVPQDIYKMVCAVTNKTVDRASGPAVGFGERIISVLAQRTPYFSPFTVPVTVKVAVAASSFSQTIFSIQEALHLDVQWSIPELPVPISGTWKVESKLEPIGPGKQYKIPKEPCLVPFVRGLQATHYTESILSEPGTLTEGIYKISVIVKLLGADDKPTNLVGYCEGPLIQIYQPL